MIKQNEKKKLLAFAISMLSFISIFIDKNLFTY